MNRPDRKLSAACFDLDGTLIDTGPLHFQAERSALATLGILELAPDHPFTFGVGVSQGMQILADHYDLESADTVLEAYLPAWELLYENSLAPLAGADAALRALNAAGVPVALVTSGESEYVNTVLERFGWASLFAHRVTLDSVRNLKPHPEPYLLAADLLGIPSGECVGFEDSPAGLESLAAAGLYAVSVQSARPLRGEAPPAHLTIELLEELTGALIEKMFSD